MKKIIITYPTKINNELNIINKLLDTNVDYVHIRKPGFTDDEINDYVSKIKPEFHYKLILHSSYHLLNKFDLGGINLSKKDLSSIINADESHGCYIEPLLNENGRVKVNGFVPNSVSYSAHSITEIEQLQFKTNYVFLSPIFDSISKPNYSSSFSDFEELKLCVKKSNRIIIALGGVTTDKIHLIEGLGFAGYAQVGAYWNSFIETSKKL